MNNTRDRVGIFFLFLKKKSKKSDLFDLNQDLFDLNRFFFFFPTTQHH